ncbi:MAG: pimeloyl-ACP methyl ester esterase BioH [Gammaproteobacteria bacterium]
MFVETAGSGPDLVLLHGWGLHGGIFAALVTQLATRFRTHAVDLPGHGRSRSAGPHRLDRWTDAVRAAVPTPAVWLGWSLGALVALKAALDAPVAVRRLVLVSATPRFATASDWPHAQERAMLDRFAKSLTQDFRRTVQDFLTLQSLGDENARTQVRALRPLLFAHGDPDPEALAGGLEILRDTDFRAELGRIDTPTLVVTGARDRLTPPAAAQALAAGLAHGSVEIIPGVAHTPFLANPDLFAARVAEFAGV